MWEVAVIEDAATAGATLDPIRARLLAELVQPGSASSLAARVGQPRQKVNYHLRELERHGLLELVEERRKGNMTERVLQATASSYVISPAALAAVEPDPAVGARLVRDVGTLITGATKAGKRVATYALDGEVRFATAQDRAAFAEELTNAVTGLVAKYHDEKAAGGRAYRVILAVHPSIPQTASDDIKATETETAATETAASEVPGNETKES
jgi:DNA-binding transcriptional ArsR family regulator